MESSSNDESVFDNGLAAGSYGLDRPRPAGRAAPDARDRASLTGQPVTPAIDNLVLEVDGATGDLDDVVAGTERGLLLTCLWYIREVDPQTLLLTGLTRDGVYLVENGEITGAVNNFRFNESPVDLLRRFTPRVGHRADLQPRVGRRLLLPDRDARPARPGLQHVERLAGTLIPAPKHARLVPTAHSGPGVRLGTKPQVSGRRGRTGYVVSAARCGTASDTPRAW